MNGYHQVSALLYTLQARGTNIIIKIKNKYLLKWGLKVIFFHQWSSCQVSVKISKKIQIKLIINELYLKIIQVLKEVIIRLLKVFYHHIFVGG